MYAAEENAMPMLMLAAPEGVEEATSQLNPSFSFFEESENGEALEMTSDEEDAEIINEVTESPTLLMSEMPVTLTASQELSTTPIDIVFLLQTSGTSQSDFNNEKGIIQSVVDSLYKTHSDVNICIIECKENEAAIIGANDNQHWLKSSSSVVEALGQLTYEYANVYCNRGAAFTIMINDVVFRENAGKYVFQIMNGYTTVGSGYYSQLNACEKGEINYSELWPLGWRYDDPSYGEMVKAAIEKTNGKSFILSSSSADDIYYHITDYVAPPQDEFNVIVPSGWKTITLDGVLDRDSNIDTDTDSLTDWEEIDTEKISWDAEGNVILPTIQQCINYATKAYAEAGLDRFKSEQEVPGMPSSDFKLYMDDVLNSTYVLPIHSDPTEVHMALYLVILLMMRM